MRVFFSLILFIGTDARSSRHSIFVFVFLLFKADERSKKVTTRFLLSSLLLSLCLVLLAVRKTISFLVGPHLCCAQMLMLHYLKRHKIDVVVRNFLGLTCCNLLSPFSPGNVASSSREEDKHKQSKGKMATPSSTIMGSTELIPRHAMSDSDKWKYIVDNSLKLGGVGLLGGSALSMLLFRNLGVRVGIASMFAGFGLGKSYVDARYVLGHEVRDVAVWKAAVSAPAE
jgi:inner membrane organizing system protein 1